MADQPKKPSYTAPPGVVLLKAAVPYNHAATLAALQSGIPGDVERPAQGQYARAPEAASAQGNFGRLTAAQTSTR